MNEEMREFLEKLHVCVYTLADGSRVLGEEIDYNYTNGLIEVYGVLEIREIDFKQKLAPYVPENLDTTFIFNERNIIGRSEATMMLKETYYSAIVAFTIALDNYSEQLKSYLDNDVNDSNDLDSLGSNWFSRN
jgi:hypothetical protein